MSDIICLTLAKLISKFENKESLQFRNAMAINQWKCTVSSEQHVDIG